MKAAFSGRYMHANHHCDMRLQDSRYADAQQGGHIHVELRLGELNPASIASHPSRSSFDYQQESFGLTLKTMLGRCRQMPCWGLRD